MNRAERRKATSGKPPEAANTWNIDQVRDAVQTARPLLLRHTRLSAAERRTLRYLLPRVKVVMRATDTTGQDWAHLWQRIHEFEASE